MITLNPPVPEIPATMESFSNLVDLLADPAASKSRISDLQAANAEYRKSAADQRAAAAAFAIAAADHKALIDQREADVAERIAAAQLAFDEKCQTRKEQLDDREARLIELQAQAASDAREAAAAKADFTRRVAIIKSATG